MGLYVFCVRALLADPAYDTCHAPPYGHGVYIWTAGQRKFPGTASPFQWKFMVGNGHAEITDVSYFNWNEGEPNDRNGRGEDCINLLPRMDYRWNDEPCGFQYCFVCENRNAH